MTHRVLQVLGRSAGGIARHVSQVTGTLDGVAGLSVDVACPPGLPIEMPKPPLELQIPDGARGHPRAIRRLRDLIRDGSYDLVHAHGLRAGIDAAVAGRGRCRAVVTVHNLVRPEIAGRVRARVDRLAEPVAVRLADRVLAVSQDIADRLKSAAPSATEKIEVLYLGIGDAPAVHRTRAEVRRELRVPDDTCLAVTVARLAPQKALHVMVDAIERTAPAVRLVIVGEGPLERELRDLVRRRSLGDRVQFLGFRRDVADIVAAADAFCLSSIWEGVPLAVQEAILLGVPVVSTEVGGMNEIVVNDRSGKLVPAGDAAALAAAIQALCSSSDERLRLAAQARADLAARFSTDAMLERLTELYTGGPREG